MKINKITTYYFGVSANPKEEKPKEPKKETISQKSKEEQIKKLQEWKALINKPQKFKKGK